MFDAEIGVGAKQIGFVADTVASGPAGAGLVASQTKFSVDPQQAQKLIDGLIEARDKLQGLMDAAERLVGVQSPGKDPYSGSATLAIRRSAGEDVGGYKWANKEAYKALTNTILNIQASLENYKNQDQATADAFKGEGNQS
ncbi:hypothetical protein F4560_007895 [Saccharothrix ecbatanensis]|uniref:PE family protein n=1 Tax=Saccharothrix ecbatanensis TaxID=1105145 RepID=A0A7W9HTB7_9PSEU|nr:hypothetical protein [Saccharothrix ecbatanensis]MBB5808127.1 hypothetical protein [Saccharothrix ecbatanensis]